jgi:signal transduction histidine kinase
MASLTATRLLSDDAGNQGAGQSKPLQNDMSGLMKARIAFGIAIGLLVACALVVYGTLRGLNESENLVQHTQHVQVLLGEMESSIASAARARLNYVFSGNDEAVNQYRTAVSHIPEKLAELRQSVKDNPAQLAHCDRLEQLITTRIDLWQKSVALKRSGAPDTGGQPDLTRQSVLSAEEIISVTQAMRDEESRLLAGRQTAAGFSFFLINAILVTSFIAAVWLLFWHYRLQRAELVAREEAEEKTLQAADIARKAENKARDAEKLAVASNEAARHLSARLLHLQDEERRRLSRELHDSTGQHLAAAKMVLSALTANNSEDRRYNECMELLDRSLQEIRTISHLLHPSGLEEAGFSTAARWYTAEFAKRSGTVTKVEITDLPERLPRDVELTLFRVLQEGLANIHRHSKSRSAEVTFRAEGPRLTLAIRDHGVGMTRDMLERFRSAGVFGVGLAGIRERVRELGGTFDLESNRDGTSLLVTIPVAQTVSKEAQSLEPLRKGSSPGL